MNAAPQEPEPPPGGPGREQPPNKPVRPPPDQPGSAPPSEPERKPPQYAAPSETAIVMHNDAVVRGLSELPLMKDVDHWGVYDRHWPWQGSIHKSQANRGLRGSVNDRLARKTKPFSDELAENNWDVGHASGGMQA